MKIFVDTNILVDVLTQRIGYVESAKILSLYTRENYSLHASTLTFANIAYIMRKVLQGSLLYDKLVVLSKFLCVESLTKENYICALQLRAKDFEDALQYFCAKDCGCELIVTNNKNDFSFSEIEVLSPSDFLKL